MIESLHIEDLGVIEEADLPLSRGLTALTGETGAGKTMFVTALDMAGASLTVVPLDDELVALWDAPTSAPGWPPGSTWTPSRPG